MASSLTTQPIALRARDVGCGDVGDAFAMDVGRGHPGVEREAGEDRRLRRGVEAVDVGGRVGLGVAERGRLVERLGEAGAGLVHPGQDEVGRAVDDAQHPVDAVARERLAQRPQQRDRAGDARLEVEVGVARARRVVQRRAVLGEQRLVGGDDGGAATERCQQQRARRLDATDDLDDDVDVVARDQPGGIGREQRRVDRQVTFAVRSAHGDADELDGCADTRGQVVAVLMQQPDDLAADDAAAEQRDL